MIKTKEVKIKPLKSAFQEVVDTVNRALDGENVRPICDTVIDSPELLAKIITPKRYEMLRVIKRKKPSSINELAKMLNRNYKNVWNEVRFLNEVGLVEIDNTKGRKKPFVAYDELGVRIPV